MQPVDHLPVFGREEFGFVSRTSAQVAQVRNKALFLAGAGTEQEEMNGQTPLIGVLVFPLRLTNDPQGRTRRVQMRVVGREEPVLQLLNEAGLLLSLFDGRKLFEVGVLEQFGRQRPIVSQEQHGHFLQTGFARRRLHPRPPFRLTEVLAAQGELLEIVIQQQEGPLRIHAGGKELQHALPLGDLLLGVSQFATQVRERAVGRVEHLVVRVVFGTGRRFDRRARLPHYSRHVFFRSRAGSDPSRPSGCPQQTPLRSIGIPFSEKAHESPP